MDVSLKSLEKVVGLLEKNEMTESLLFATDTSDGINFSEKNNAVYDTPNISSGIPGFDDQERNTRHIMCRNYSTVKVSEAANYRETDNEVTVTTPKGSETVCTLKVSKECADIEAKSFETNEATEIIISTTVNRRTNDENSESLQGISIKITDISSVITYETEIVNNNKGVITCSAPIDDLATSKETTAAITSKEKAEAPSKELSKDVFPNNVLWQMVINLESKKLSQQICETQKFFGDIDSTNKDMEKKSGILLQKQNLVDEIVSYICAVQSIIRLSTSRSVLASVKPNDSMIVHPNKDFYDAGVQILEELKLYRSELKADFKIWETYRLEILEISEQMPYDFDMCEDKVLAKVLMHNISTTICKILKSMETVTSKREDTNENCIDLMDSVDTYIRYSSAFIMDGRTLNIF